MSRESWSSLPRITTSNPSSITSTMRSVKSRSNCISGYRSMNAEITGKGNPAISAKPTRKRPRGEVVIAERSSSAAWISARIRLHLSRKTSPSEVSLTVRVLRWNRRLWIFMLWAGGTEASRHPPSPCKVSVMNCSGTSQEVPTANPDF